MIIYSIGNPMVKEDSIPLRILPRLRIKFPEVEFREADPNENFVPEKGSVIIDTVAGIDSVMRFDDINRVALTTSVSPHDYDLGFHLLLLNKLGKLPQCTIIGVPVTASVDTVTRDVISVIEKMLIQA